MDQKELRDLEALCVQEEPPACSTACPIHVDVSLMLRQTAEGDYASAFKTYRKMCAFPDLLSRICDAPCGKACRMAEIGDGLKIKPIERFLCEKMNINEPQQMLPEKKKSAAIMGSSLDSLTCAYDLRRKGWKVSIFEVSDKFGSQLNAVAKTILPNEVIENVEKMLEKMNIHIHLSCGVDISSIHADENGLFHLMDQDFHCVFIPSSEVNQNPTIDPITRMCATEGIFSGEAGHEEWAKLAGEGKRSAISMDRYMQKVSLTASRVREGGYETRLYTSLKDIHGSTSQLGDTLTEDAIQAEASRCIHCTCMECAKGCEFIRHYGDYPRIYLRQMYNNICIVTGLRQKNTMINSCSVCGQCEAICPNKFPYAPKVLETRRTMVRTEKMPPSAFDFAQRDMQFSNGDKAALSRNPTDASVRYAFFPGCQLSGQKPETVEKVYALLQEQLNQPVGIMLRCCGAIANWAGNEAMFQEAHDALVVDYEKLGKPELIVGCPTCIKTFAEFYPEIKTTSLWVFLKEQNFAQTENMTCVAAIHDPCGARYDTEMQESVRKICKDCGVTLEELEYTRDQTPCCTYGGNTWNANAQLSKNAIDSRIAENPHPYITYCAMCQDFFQSRGKNAYHVLDLLFDREMVFSGKPIPKMDFSMRHENRARLKRDLLKKYWSEDMTEPESFEKIKLFISPEVRKTMEERMILIEDIQRVIEHAEQTGKRLISKETGHYLTHHNPVVVTYWVEYLPKEDGYEVFSAYSHRLFVVEEEA